MIYLRHRPSYPLSLAVESIWLYAGYQPPHRLERVLPSGTVEWLINLSEDRLRCYDPQTFALQENQPGTLIAGTRSSVQIIDTEQQSEIMGVHLHPGGLRYLTAIPADEFAEKDVPLEHVWGGFASEVRERLLARPSPQAKVLALEEMLQARFCLERAPHSAVPEALRKLSADPGPLRLGGLAAELGLSSRRFIHVFSSSVGLTPKVYARIRRFQRALGSIQRAKVTGWADLAFDCGWYDQAHMIRDFKEFSGLTPTEYVRLQGKFILHVPVEERGQIYPIPAMESVAGCHR